MAMYAKVEARGTSLGAKKQSKVAIANHQQLHFAMLQQEVLLWFLAHTQHCINGNIGMLHNIIFL
jgi:hypothetical protein